MNKGWASSLVLFKSSSFGEVVVEVWKGRWRLMERGGNVKVWVGKRGMVHSKGMRTLLRGIWRGLLHVRSLFKRVIYEWVGVVEFIFGIMFGV